MSSFTDLWDDRDKLAGQLANGVFYRCPGGDECEAPDCACPDKPEDESDVS